MTQLSDLTRQRRRDEGFTLVELLVVITILAVLAGVVVFAVNGIGDKGQAASSATEASILRTAEEAYYAKNGRYGTVADLRAGGFLASDPGYAAVTPINGGTGFVIGAQGTSTSTNGPRILAAANNTPSFSFLQSDFVAQNSAVQFSFGASSGLATTATTPGNTDVAFASADEANVNKTIATGDTVAGGAAGTCTASGSVQCAGVGSSKVLYAIGRLVVFSCKSGARTLPPASGSAANCAAPAGGFLGAAPTTVAGVVALLQNNPSFKLAIANPGPIPPTPGSTPTAPYGLAAYQALTSSAADGGGLTQSQFSAYVTSGQIVYGANVTATQTIVETGAAQVALLPQSFVKSPAGDDGNNWTAVATGLHDPIKQWAVALDHGSGVNPLATSFLNYLVSPRAQGVLAAFGYQPLS